MLERTESKIRVERSTRKEPLSDDEAASLLARVEVVIVAKGRKTIELMAAEARPDDLKGPTGGFRAPMIVAGGTLLVGFHGETLEALVSQ